LFEASAGSKLRLRNYARFFEALRFFVVFLTAFFAALRFFAMVVELEMITYKSTRPRAKKFSCTNVSN